MLIKTRIVMDNQLTGESSTVWGFIDLENIGAIVQSTDGKQIYLYNANGDLSYVIEDSFNAVCDKFIKSRTILLPMGEN